MSKKTIAAALTLLALGLSTLIPAPVEAAPRVEVQIRDQIASMPDLGRHSVVIDRRLNTVTLSGETGSAEARSRIVAAARRIASPDYEIEDRIAVKPGFSPVVVIPATPRMPTDQELTRRVLGALQENEIPTNGLEISASSGTVIIRGERSNHREVDAILSVANMVDGVRDVQSEMKYAGLSGFNTERTIR